MLDVRLPVLARGREVERPLACDELGEDSIDLGVPAAILFETRIGGPRAVPRTAFTAGEKGMSVEAMSLSLVQPLKGWL